jgi:hypothetical protein
LAGKGQVNCHCCNGETKKFGRFQNRNRIVQRYQCLKCGKTMSESQPLNGIRTDAGEAAKVINMLCEGMAGRFQLTTDAFPSYWHNGGAVRTVFGNEIDYATETKIFNSKPRIPTPWYNPLVLLRIQRQKRCGKPEMKLATICHAERMNLSLRLFNRRFTRKTLGYSKKLENMRHAMAIFVAHFNFCRIHSAHGRTPAQAANLTDHQWTIEEMLAETI